MAGAGAKLFADGNILTADDLNEYLMDQTIMRFASTAARDAAFGGANEPVLAEGMFAYTTDTNTLWLYNGSSWVNVLGSDIGEQALSNRNVIINGAMQVAQRGTSASGLTDANSSYHTADRWRLANIGLGTWTQSVEADAPTGSGFRNSLKMLCTTADASPAAADLLIINQRLEGQNLQQFLKGTSSAKPFAVSFWVKSNVTGTYIAELLDADNTRQVSASYSISASATWEKKTIIFPADTTGAFDNDNAQSLQLLFNLGVGSDRTSGTLNTTWASTTNANRAVGQTNLAAATNNYWQITGVQLEVGAVATPFEFEDISKTVEKCQRYFEKSYNLTVNPATDTIDGMTIVYVPVAGLANVGGTVFFKTRKRANPSITAYSKVGTSGNFSNAFAPPSGDVATTAISSPGESSFIFYNLTTAASSMAIHWVASSEL